MQFSNEVSANTHKKFTLEILMTMAHILDGGMSSSSFRLEGVEQVVPYDIRELLGFQKGAPEQVYVHEGTLEGFWSVIAGGAHQQRNSIWNSIIQVFQSWMCKMILGRKRDKDNQHGVELALLSFDCPATHRPHSPMINRWCCEATPGSGDIGSGCYLSMLAISFDWVLQGTRSIS
jgi:hypothetical protein